MVSESVTSTQSITAPKAALKSVDFQASCEPQSGCPSRHRPFTQPRRPLATSCEPAATSESDATSMPVADVKVASAARVCHAVQPRHDVQSLPRRPSRSSRKELAESKKPVTTHLILGHRVLHDGPAVHAGHVSDCVQVRIKRLRTPQPSGTLESPTTSVLATALKIVCHVNFRTRG